MNAEAFYQDLLKYLKEGLFQKASHQPTPVYFVDERYSSVVLEGDVQYQESLDSHAAALILEQFFREQG